MAPHTAVATGAGSGGEGPERHVDKPTVERVGVGRVQEFGPSSRSLRVNRRWHSQSLPSLKRMWQCDG
jgi:hypothetical protein